MKTVPQHGTRWVNLFQDNGEKIKRKFRERKCARAKKRRTTRCQRDGTIDESMSTHERWQILQSGATAGDDFFRQNCLSCISEKIFLAQLSAAWADGIDNGDDAGGAAECDVILFHVTACY